MRQVIIFLITLCLGLYSSSGFAQGNINRIEYFFDTDPGFGNGTSVTIATPAVNINSLGFNANVATLSNGMHTMYVRSRSAGGSWSVTTATVIAKVQPLFTNASAVTNITKAEYFYDTDPGFGNGTNIPLSASTNISSMVFNANVSPLTNGMHTLYVRTKDATGWSITAQLLFAKVQPLMTNPNAVANIVKMEYFYDVDPGFGNGADIPIAAASNISSMVVNADVSSLSSGLHSLYIRTKDAQGKWSITSAMQFSKIRGIAPNPHNVSNINTAEYFFDADPGYGNGVNIPVTAGTDVSSLVFNANVTALANGMHTLYVRTRDVQGQWSKVNYFSFAKVQPLLANPHTNSNITRIEYFVDTDPGVGNGVPVSFTSGQDVSSVTFNVNMALISNDNHKLYIRARNAQGKWSITNVHSFLGGTAPLAIKLVSFEARLLQDQTVLLEWIVEQEHNVASYLIERSSDAETWSYVGEQQPVSSSNAARHHYQLEDKEPGTGIAYYRLTETDLEGNKTQAPIRFVRIDKGNGTVASVYPNPNSGAIVHVSSDLFATGEVVVSVIGADGKIHMSQKVHDVSTRVYSLTELNLAAGNYFVNLQGKNRAESLKLQVTGR